MQDNFYGLRGNGFKLTPDHRLRFAHPSYTGALELILDAQRQGEGFVVLTAPPGTGKTTLIEELVARLSADGTTVARLSSTQVTAEELLRLIAFAFGMNASGATKAVLLDQLESHLRQHRPQGKCALLIIDEAQDLDAEALEELRLITNFTVDTEPLVQILLVGQERLWDTLFRPELDRIHQRIIVSCQLQPLTATQTRFYVAHRLSCVGWTGDPCISGDAISLIHDYALGVPRLINRITNRLLAYGANAKLHVLERSHAEEVLQQLAFDHLRPRQGEADALGLNARSDTPPLASLDAAAFATMSTGQRPAMKIPQTPPRSQPRIGADKGRTPANLVRSGGALNRLVSYKNRVLDPLKRRKTRQGQTSSATRRLAPGQRRPKQDPHSAPTIQMWKVPSISSTIGDEPVGKHPTPPRASHQRWATMAAIGALLAGLALWAYFNHSLDPATLARFAPYGAVEPSATKRNSSRHPSLPTVTGQQTTSTAPSGTPLTTITDAETSSKASVASPRNPVSAQPDDPTSRSGPEPFVNTSPKSPPVEVYPGFSPLPPSHRDLVDSNDLKAGENSAGFANRLTPDTRTASEPVEQHPEMTGGESSLPRYDQRTTSTLADEGLERPGNDQMSPLGLDLEVRRAATSQPKPMSSDQRELLASARRALSDYRLTLPPQDNAYDYFQAVLAKSPNNAIALAGLWQIARKYEELARRKIVDEDLAEAERLVRRGLKVMPDDRGLLDVARELEDLKKQLEAKDGIGANSTIGYVFATQRLPVSRLHSVETRSFANAREQLNPIAT